MNRVLKWLRYTWIAFLLYLVIGCIGVMVLDEMELITSACHDPSFTESPSLPLCEPCSLNYEMWGLVSLSECENEAYNVLWDIFGFTPQFIVTVLFVITYPIFDFPADISQHFPTALYSSALIVIAFRTIQLLKKKRIRQSQAVHRFLLMAICGILICFYVRG